MLGDIVINDMGDACDVEPASGNIGSNKDWVFAGAETCEGFGSLRLRSVGVEDPDGMGEVGKAASDAVGAHPGAAENDDAFVVRFFQEAEKEFVFLIRRHGIKRVGDGFGGGLAEADFDRDGLF